MELILHEPRPARPDDGILGKGIIKVQHELPPDVCQLCRDLHDDRAAIGTACMIVLALMIVCVLRYALDWRRGR